MLIAVNTRMLQRDKLEGIGYFCYESFRRITAAHPGHQFVFIFDRPFDDSFIFGPNVSGIHSGPAARHPILWYLWYEFTLPRLLKRIKPDLFVSPDGYLPLRSDVKSLAVIHDINFEHFPGDLPLFNRTYYRYFFPRYARHATRIATVSRFSADDLSKTYGIATEKIDVVYNGVSPGFNPIPDLEAEKIRMRWTGGAPYFLFIGSIHQRKNIVKLLLAFDRFRTATGSSLQLVFAGTKRWWTDEMETTYQSMHHKEAVIFTGRLSEKDLHEITGAAFALTYVSTFEGFGIPLLEAMRAGVPVLTANVTSMPEVAGDAALLVDPFDEDSISEGMIELYKNENLRKSLILKGLSRHTLFSWEKTADRMWESMMKAVN